MACMYMYTCMQVHACVYSIIIIIIYILLHYVTGKHHSPVSTNKRTISFVSDTITTTTTTTTAATTSITTATTPTTNSLSKPSNAIGGKNSTSGVGKLLMHTYIHVNCV